MVGEISGARRAGRAGWRRTTPPGRRAEERQAWKLVGQAGDHRRFSSCVGDKNQPHPTFEAEACPVPSRRSTRFPTGGRGAGRSTGRQRGPPLPATDLAHAPGGQRPAGHVGAPYTY